MDTLQNSSCPFRELRLKAGFSQTQITKALDVTRNTVTRWDHGEWRPRWKHLRAIPNFLPIDLSEAVALFWKESVGDRCSCCDGVKVFPDRDGAKHLYVDLPCQNCGKSRPPYRVAQGHRALCETCSCASRKVERVPLRCRGYRPFPSVTIHIHAEGCEYNKEFLAREIAKAKYKKDPGEGYPFVDVERGEYRCGYCAGAFRLLQATKKQLRKQWAETHPTERFPRIRSKDDLRRLKKKLTNQAVFESKKPDKKIRGKDRPRRIHPAVPERTRKWRREKPPASLRGLCGRCVTLLFSYKMSRPLKFHQECLWIYQREHGAEAGPRNPDGTFTPESSKPIKVKTRRGPHGELENLRRNFDWAVRHKLLNDSLGDIVKSDSWRRSKEAPLARSTVVDGIAYIMDHLPLPERVPKGVMRQRILALRSCLN